MFYRGLRPASSLAHRSLKIGSVYPKNLWASTSLQVQPRRWNSGAEPPLDIPLGSVIDHITGKRIRVELEELQRSSISLEEYMTLARKNGLDEEDAKSLLKSLHDTGKKET